MYSQDLLKLMGIRLASEFINEHISKEERLWKGVIVTALEDCLNTSDGKVEAYRKHEAHLWFLKKDEDFKDVCWMANIEPDLVYNRYLELHQKEIIFFTAIQKLWISYRENYKVYRECKSKKQRVLVKKNIERIKIKIEGHQNDR
jgi:hypothetical protein